MRPKLIDVPLIYYVGHRQRVKAGGCIFLDNRDAAGPDAAPGTQPRRRAGGSTFPSVRRWWRGGKTRRRLTSRRSAGAEAVGQGSFREDHPGGGADVVGPCPLDEPTIAAGIADPAPPPPPTSCFRNRGRRRSCGSSSPPPRSGRFRYAIDRPTALTTPRWADMVREGKGVFAKLPVPTTYDDDDDD
jgi:hypothetical protein